MTTVVANGVTLGVEHFGEAAAPLVLLAGSTTMLSWPDALCEALARGGRHVVRYDLRDSGESTTIDPAAPAYTLRDLAADAAALARGLDDRPAHLAGIGVGGMVAQVAALEHPDAFSALTLAGTRPVAPGPIDDDLRWSQPRGRGGARRRARRSSATTRPARATAIGRTPDETCCQPIGMVSKLATARGRQRRALRARSPARARSNAPPSARPPLAMLELTFPLSSRWPLRGADVEPPRHRPPADVARPRAAEVHAGGDPPAGARREVDRAASRGTGRACPSAGGSRPCG